MVLRIVVHKLLWWRHIVAAYMQRIGMVIDNVSGGLWRREDNNAWWFGGQSCGNAKVAAGQHALQL